MEFHQIRYFLAVAEKHSFTRAAHYVHVSQPSLTQAIKKLEEELGGALFLRDRAGCQLTALGRLMEPKLRQIYDQTQRARQDAVRFSEQDQIPIRIGLMHTIGSRLIARALAGFQTENPTVELELHVEPESAIGGRLLAGDFDMIITSPATPLGAGFESHLLYRERYAFVFSPEHTFATRKDIGLADLSETAYLDRLNCEFREDLNDICSQRNLDLHATYRSNSEHWILEMARQELGVALAPVYSLPEGDPNLCSRLLTEPPLSREVYAIVPVKTQYKEALAGLLHRLTE